MSKPLCCVCHKPHEGTTFVLTPEERLASPKAPESIHYCKACLRVMQDREAGANLLKGFYEMHLRELGVPNARAAADGFIKRLLQSTARNLH